MECTRRFSSRFLYESVFASIMAFCESATKTTPSAPFQDEPARFVVEDLSRNGIQLDAGFHPADLAQVERQEVEEQGAIRLRRQRQHLPLHRPGRLSKMYCRLVVFPHSPGP
jgi:hypothetical protein